MKFLRRMASILTFAAVLAGCAPRLCAQPSNAPAPSAVSGQTSDAAQTVYHLPPEKLAKAIALSRIRIVLGFAGSVWMLAVLWILLASRAFAGVERWTARALKRRWLAGLLFYALFFLITAAAGLPLAIYHQHVERAYGISVQGWGGWTGDRLKSLGIEVLLGAPLLLLFHAIVRRWPRRYWFGAWLVTLPLLAIGVFVAPLLEPVFNKFEPLAKSNPALVTRLEEVAARTGTSIPPARIFLMKASLKTNGLNAYVSGMGRTKRIVVWDTTAGRIPNDETMFIFAHESGHYVLHHIVKGCIASAIFLFFLYWACAALATLLKRRWGQRWGLTEEAGLFSRTGLLALLLIISIASFFTEPISAAFSRAIEHEADVYGQEAIHGLVPDPQRTAVASFNDLGEAWLEDPNPHPFVEFWSYDHPSVQHRANFALHYDPWANGGRGRFFSK